MSNSVRTSLLHRLWQTPLRDWVRGQLNGRLDWRARLSASNLPLAARELIARVVQRTRLWRIEKAAVAEELIAHFLDALEKGESIEAVLTAFGDPQSTAQLIRRSKIRSRPILWHGWRWLRGCIVLLLIGYAGLAASFFFAHPAPSVDYVAELNRPLIGIPEADRAWPLYRQAIFSMFCDPHQSNKRVWPDWAGYSMDGKHWPEAQVWIRQHAADVEGLRQATAKPVMGFVLGSGGSINDEELWRNYFGHDLIQDVITGTDRDLLIAVRLPYLNDMRMLAEVLQADAKLAQLDHDGPRLDRDITAIFQIAEHVRRNDPFLVTGLVALGIDSIGLDTIERVLNTEPQALSDEQWIGLAHLLSVPQTASDLITLRGERMSFRDMVQHMYSDDGRGDGHFTADGLRLMNQIQNLYVLDASTKDHSERNSLGSGFRFAAAPGLILTSLSRKSVLVEFDRTVDAEEADFHHPLRDVFPRPVDPSLALSLPAQSLGSLFSPSDMGNPYSCARVAEIILGRRDGVTTAMALELFHRRHGAYPQRLDELVPAFLPAIPADRITGDPIRYRLISGRPVLYSVGADRIDDGGTPATVNGKLRPTGAAAWPARPQKIFRGDWILFPQLPASPQDDE